MATVKERLESLAHTDTSTDADSSWMQNFLRHVGFQKAVVTCGIVYLDGQGTLEAPPTDIHSIAQMILSKA